MKMIGLIILKWPDVSWGNCRLKFSTSVLQFRRSSWKPQRLFHCGGPNLIYYRRQLNKYIIIPCLSRHIMILNWCIKRAGKYLSYDLTSRMFWNGPEYIINKISFGLYEWQISVIEVLTAYNLRFELCFRESVHFICRCMEWGLCGLCRKWTYWILRVD